MPISEQNEYFCYIIKPVEPTNCKKTYNGSTNNLKRRLRQHNGIIKGGAKSTKGNTWEYFVIIKGFKSKIEALSCEWKIKHPTNTKRRPQKYNGPEGRVKSLELVINTDTWTSKSSGLEDLTNIYTLYANPKFIPILTQFEHKPNLIIKDIKECNLI